jgi:VIT1/CCC1 family predicted Fe2+/Mn2+ transporter
LGLQDAIVELTGVITGLALALADNRMIVLTVIVTGAAGAMSMTAANYLAQKTDNNKNAVAAGIATGASYILTALFLLIPFLIMIHHITALVFTFITAATVIFIFNYIIGKIGGRPWHKQFMEMIIVVGIVSTAAFAIGLLAKRFLGI